MCLYLEGRKEIAVKGLNASGHTAQIKREPFPLAIGAPVFWLSLTSRAPLFFPFVCTQGSCVFAGNPVQPGTSSILP